MLGENGTINAGMFTLESLALIRRALGQLTTDPAGLLAVHKLDQRFANLERILKGERP